MRDQHPIHSDSGTPLGAPEDHNDDSETRKPSWLWVVLIALGIILLWAASWYFIANRYSQWPVRGTFGDMFGAVNALFSGLAFAGVIFAIILQRRELELQRRELRLNRQELSRSAGAQERSQDALSEQVGALERSARLSAVAALVNSYGREIDTLMDAERYLAGQVDEIRFGTPRNITEQREQGDRLEDFNSRLQAVKGTLRKRRDKVADLVAILEREVEKVESTVNPGESG